MTFFRVFQHLLPSGAAWTTTITKTLRKFFEGLAGTPQGAKDYIDDVFEDAFPDTTRELAEWQKQFGLEPSGTEDDQRLALAAEWAAGGGQSPSYIQGVLQTAGFPLYVHEWWSSGPPYVARDPRAYTTIPLIGTVQCSALPDQPQCGDGVTPVYVSPGVPQFECNRFLVNDPHYIVNKNLTDEAPPPIPDDPDTWPYFIYVGAATFPNFVNISEEQRPALERLLLKLRPLQNWIVTRVIYTSSDEMTEEDAVTPILEEDGATVVLDS